MSQNQQPTAVNQQAEAAKAEAAKAEAAKKAAVKVPMYRSATGGLFVHPYTQQRFDVDPKAAQLDSWLKSQIEAGKIAVV